MPKPPHEALMRKFLFLKFLFESSERREITDIESKMQSACRQHKVSYNKKDSVISEKILSELLDIFPFVASDKELGLSLIRFLKYRLHVPVSNLARNKESKLRLATCAVERIKTCQSKKLFVGTGTTAYSVLQQLVLDDYISKITYIASNNLLALCLAIWELPDHVKFDVVQGSLDKNYGMIAFPQVSYRDQLKNSSIDTIITSFKGISFDKGFFSDDRRDSQEKLMNLRPPFDSCRNIIIPIGWDKIGDVYATSVVASKEDLVLDSNITYWMITDPPSGTLTTSDREKEAEIDRWRQYNSAIRVLSA